MTEEQSKLRDEFAKIAFKEIIGATLPIPEDWSVVHKIVGIEAYKLADQAMEARDAK